MLERVTHCRREIVLSRCQAHVRVPNLSAQEETTLFKGHRTVLLIGVNSCLQDSTIVLSINKSFLKILHVGLLVY